MNILYISYAYPVGGKGLYGDLGEALAEKGHNVKVVVSNTKIVEPTKIISQNGVEILCVKTAPLFNIGKIKKAISILTLPGKFKNAIRKHYINESFDLILFEAPPISLVNVVKWAKRTFNCPAFVQQKDIFPENVADLNLISRKSPIYGFFRRMEINMLSTADYIGYMSNGNRKFLLEHNVFLSPNKCVYFPNSMKISEFPEKNRRAEICEKLKIVQDSCILLFGGNIGHVQCVDFLCKLLIHFKGNSKVYFLVIGNGIFEKKVISAIADNKISNAQYISSIPRDEYNDIANHCDVGLIIVDPRFTIPNYPSKTLGYMHSGIPILAATDLNTDYRNLIEDEAKCGLWAHSGDFAAFVAKLETIAENPQLRQELGQNGRQYLEKYFDVQDSVNVLEELFSEK